MPSEKPKLTVGESVKLTPKIKCSIGGQALIEGVMMSGKRSYTMAVRAADSSIKTETVDFTPISEKLPILKAPFLRGVVSFINSMIMGVKLIYRSAELAGYDDLTEENPTKFDLWLQKTFGDKLYNYVMGFSVVLSLILGIAIFMLFPAFVTSLLKEAVSSRVVTTILEGLLRIGIFVSYISLVSLNRDIKRVYQYHGAEHKTIICYEQGLPLTTENVRKQTRLHKRCGTSFLIIVMLVSMFIFFFITTKTLALKLLFRLLLLPVIAGISYEIIKVAGRSGNFLVRLISYPGLLLQKVTTLEPDDEQIEIAIASLKGELEHEQANA